MLLLSGGSLQQSQWGGYHRLYGRNQTQTALGLPPSPPPSPVPLPLHPQGLSHRRLGCRGRAVALGDPRGLKEP